MTWGGFSDDFFVWPEVQAALAMPGGGSAILLHHAAVLYCARELTDGVLTPTAVKIIAAQAGVPPRRAGILHHVGLWEGRGENAYIPSYLECNQTRKVVEERKRQGAERQRQWKSRQDNAKADVEGNAGSNAVTHDRPLPLPLNVDGR